jgi:hypothetical protein
MELKGKRNVETDPQPMEYANGYRNTSKNCSRHFKTGKTGRILINPHWK